ncbi:MAG: hydroxysqualene dehydroxylase HpnE [Caldimonas sp.]
MARRVAVVGAGWAGLAAAVEATRAGAQVTVFEMAPAVGGRARDVVSHGSVLDNGAHICIGAYAETLRLLGLVGVEESAVFLRRPLTLVDAEGAGLRMSGGAPLPAFVRAVLARRGWRWGERLALLRVSARWRRAGFDCAPEATVADLCDALPERVRQQFIEPLCVAALNTPAAEASGTVFLRVLRDALGSAPGAADLLLPTRALGEVFPAPALAWLRGSGATVQLARRIEALSRDGDTWQVDGEPFDRVVLATSAVEAARLAAPHASAWAETAARLRYEPIVTVYARSVGCVLPEPLLALPWDASRPAQFVFDRGRLVGDAGLLAFVISGAAVWVERGAADIEQATLAQARTVLAQHLRGPLEVVRTLTEKRATFACTPRLARPPMDVARGLIACGDYVAGPYPATLEGAVRSGVAAAAGAAF